MNELNMSNLNIYELSRKVPKEALKEIGAGRLKGKSDINPMWRIKQLTEIFGPCGFGWKYTIDSERLESSPTGEISAFVKISLYVKYNGEWSDSIPGTGGSSFVANESKGPYTSDECFKMALTDAISVSCKALGFGADVYWDKDSTKYSAGLNITSINTNTPPVQQKSNTGQNTQSTSGISEAQGKRLFALMNQHGKTKDEVVSYTTEHFKKTSSKELTVKEYNKLCDWMEGK